MRVMCEKAWCRMAVASAGASVPSAGDRKAACRDVPPPAASWARFLADKHAGVTAAPSGLPTALWFAGIQTWVDEVGHACNPEGAVGSAPSAPLRCRACAAEQPQPQRAAAAAAAAAAHEEESDVELAIDEEEEESACLVADAGSPAQPQTASYQVSSPTVRMPSQQQQQQQVARPAFSHSNVTDATPLGLTLSTYGPPSTFALDTQHTRAHQTAQPQGQTPRCDNRQRALTAPELRYPSVVHQPQSAKMRSHTHGFITPAPVLSHQQPLSQQQQQSQTPPPPQQLLQQHLQQQQTQYVVDAQQHVLYQQTPTRPQQQIILQDCEVILHSQQTNSLFEDVAIAV